MALTSNGNSFLLYNLEKLRLERISPPLEHKITCFAMYKNKVFTGVKNRIILWDKIHIVKEYFDTSEDQDFEDFHFTKLLIFDKLIVAISSVGALYLFDIYSGDMIKKLNLGCDIVIHPATYLNKILFTKKSENYENDLMLNNTKLYIYNINTEKLIYEINLEKHLENSENNLNIKVTNIEQSPIIDVVAIGFNTGEIILHNLKLDKKILYFKAETAIKALSFTSCVGLNLSLLASSDSRGNIQFWDLNKQTLNYTLKSKDENHLIDSLLFLPNEPILVTSSGSGNFIKMYKLEANTGVPQLLKLRAGHSEAPHKVRFYGGEQIQNNFNNHILSLSSSDMRNISLINEHLSKQFSMKNLPKEIKHQLRLLAHRQKNSHGSVNSFLSQEEIYEDFLANKLSDFDFNEFRERDWSNILLRITNSAYPLLLSYEDASITDKNVKIKNTQSICSAICVSMCGNFGFAGFENGAIEKFNMQSGNNKWQIPNAHSKAVIAVKSDAINSLLVSAGLDQKLNFWEIFQSSLVKSLELPSTPVQMELYRDNDLIAVSCHNYNIYIYDKSNFKLVRRFENFFKAKINDLAYANEGKWLCAVSDDKSLKIFDIISNNLIEWLEYKNIPISLSVSPTSQYFALTFNNKKGLFIWLNRTMFSELADFDTEKVSEAIKINMPLNNMIRRLKTRKEISEKEKEEKITNQINEKQKIKKKKEQEIIQEDNKDLIILSKENKLKYRILNNLEKIQERSEPQIKKKEKAKAPFFLFNINDLFGSSNEKAREKAKDKDNQKELPVTEGFFNILKNYTHFKNEKILKDKTDSENNLLDKKELILLDLLNGLRDGDIRSSEITLFLNSLNPYLIDLEIRNMDPFINFDTKENAYRNRYLDSFLDYLHEEILQRSNFEMIQAYLNRFLKVIKYFINEKFYLFFLYKMLYYLRYLLIYA